MEKFKELLDNANSIISEFEKFKEAGLIPKSGDFYPAGVHYPPITMYENIGQNKFYENYAPIKEGEYDIYVHIPFCRRRCVFCHYPSLYGAKEAVKDRYLDYLKKEIDLYTEYVVKKKIQARTILIGGGTPTDLSPAQLRRFLEYFTEKINIENNIQFNYDIDPSTITGDDGIERLKIMKEFGVDRLTIGVQSFNDHILKKMNRDHDRETALMSIENSMKYGFQTNIEFIFGYPGQDLEIWYEDMKCAVDTDVEEIQMYRLKTLPYGDQVGIINKIKQEHPERLPSNEEAMLMKKIAIDYLAENGYHENLRRVFAKNKKFISKYAYNQCCILQEEIGFGLTAFGSLKDRFYLNTQNFDEYYNKIDNNELPINRGIIRSHDEQERWAIILPLKNYWINKKIFKDRCGAEIGEMHMKKLRTLENYGLVKLGDKKIELTKMGAFFSDEVVMQFSDKKYLPYHEAEYNDGQLSPYKI